MSQTFEFCDQQARAAFAAAESAVLDNVRDRELRSAKAWEAMATRQRQVDARRVKAEEVRIARLAAEQADQAEDKAPDALS